MYPIVLFRRFVEHYEEMQVAAQYFKVTAQRTGCLNNLVIGRYSCYPYYRELCVDLENLGSHLLNSYPEHRWISDFDWYIDLSNYTPETWFSLTNTNYEGPFIVKGKLFSKKYNWNKSFYAPNREDAIRIYCELKDDYEIGLGDVIFRKYVPLKTFDIGVNGVRFTNEWRFFYYKTTLLCYGYYWSIADEKIIKSAYINNQTFELLNNIVPIIAAHTNFYCVDVAETEQGNWILIEINEGSQSGLAECDPHEFYKNLKNAI